jgi:hypothetical protein
MIQWKRNKQLKLVLDQQRTCGDCKREKEHDDFAPGRHASCTRSFGVRRMSLVEVGPAEEG